MKETAVEWLEKRFEKFLAYYEGHHKAEMYSIHQLSNDFDQAKEMEKRQMIEMHDKGFDSVEQLNDEFAIEFAEWLTYNRENNYTKSIKELLEIFKNK
jgi:hypothetical protein